MKAIITIELDYPEQIYDLYETKEIRFYDKDGVYSLWEGGFEIKPVPDKLDWKVGYARGKNTCEIFNKNYVDGYNSCINEILGEEE